MPCACIDVGSNTIRLLVAESDRGRLRELLTQRAFPRLGRALHGGDRRLTPEKIEEAARVVGTQAGIARSMGARKLCVVATAVVREAVNSDELVAALERAAGVPVWVLSGQEEARLAFVGATKTLGTPLEGQVGVVDVGGGSTEIVVGTLAGGASWAESFRIGSGFLADSYLHSDPPAAAELHAVRQHVIGAFEGLEVPPPERSVAVGGSATSLRRLVGAVLEHETLDRSLRVLSGSPAVEVGRRFELDPERVRLLPAGILILDEVSTRLGQPLQIGNGGLREGVILELIAAD